MLLRPKLEYATVAWNPHKQNNIDTLENERDEVLRMSGGTPFAAHCQSAALRRLGGRNDGRDVVESTADERRPSVSRSLSIRSTQTIRWTKRWTWRCRVYCGWAAVLRFPLTVNPQQPDDTKDKTMEDPAHTDSHSRLGSGVFTQTIP